MFYHKGEKYDPPQKYVMGYSARFMLDNLYFLNPEFAEKDSPQKREPMHNAAR